MYYFPKKLGGPNALLAPPFHSLGGPWPPWPPPWRTPWFMCIMYPIEHLINLPSNLLRTNMLSFSIITK